MPRNAAIVPLHPAALESLLALKPDAGYIVHVEHDHARGRLLLHLRGPELPEVPDDSEAPLVGWLGRAAEVAARHPLGQLVAALATIGHPAELDLVDALERVRELTYDTADLHPVFDAGEPITGGTKAALIELAAYLVAVAGVTLDHEEADTLLGLERALGEDRQHPDTLIPAAE